jgi:uncharacterized DUF497 family protein
MHIEFDREKDLINIRKHGISLAMAEKLDWDAADCWVDSRYEYGELCMTCFAFLGLTVYHVTYVERGGVYRIISLREATKKEERVYARIFSLK